MNWLTRVFLVLLRIAIGWHFLFEAVEKIESVYSGSTETNRPWNSAGFLKESTGPFSPFFHQIVGGNPDDKALERLSVRPLHENEDSSKLPPHRRMSPSLEAHWDQYVARFVAYYKLTDEPLPFLGATTVGLLDSPLGQGPLLAAPMLTPGAVPDNQRAAAARILDQSKDRAVVWLLGLEGAKDTEKLVGTGSITVKETVPQRVAAYREKLNKIRDIQANEMWALNRDVYKQRFRTLKAQASQMRAELLADLDRLLTDDLQRVLTEDQRNKGPVPDPDATSPGDWLSARGKAMIDKDTEVPVAPSLLAWNDWIIRYVLLAIGACLIAGLFSRTASVLGALFLLSICLAMPAFPWLPENTRVEGHYFFVTKNVIEMLALLTLATTCSGRWLGLDGLLHALNPFRRHEVPVLRRKDEILRPLPAAPSRI